MPGMESIHSTLPQSPLNHLRADLRSLPVYRCDALILGSGVAGLSTALSAADQGVHVMVLSKGALDDTNTRHAQGGMASAIGPNDSPALHSADSLAVGGGIAEDVVVDAFTTEGPAAVEWLEKLGMRLDRYPDGSVSLGKEGGHRMPRILHSGGTATGLEIQRALGVAARAHSRIDFCEFTSGIELLKDSEGRVCGLLALMGSESSSPTPVLFEADAIVAATGGSGQLFRETTNPDMATGDGLAMALRAGAELQDLEFVQFHPTILYLAGAARFLISEVTRGAGAHLVDREGNRFMPDEHPDAELAPRDVVSRAIFRRMIESGDTHVYLDFSEVKDPASRFPALARMTGEFGIQLSKEPVPVRPAVHYMIGGIRSSLDGHTNLEGLWAVGECASTGFHGANRMGSNSLLEGVVHGRKVGQNLADSLLPSPRRFLCPSLSQNQPVSGAQLSLTDMTYSLKSLMWRQVGVERDAGGLQDALQRLETWEGYLDRLCPFTREGVEVLNMVQVSRMVVLAALTREESRGAHFRTDFSTAQEDWRCHSLVRCDPGGLFVGTTPVKISADTISRDS
ncbi:MAG: L-aspartate oxidase [Planctomycetota bacterium]|nr:L-aspartate oxidase [Planctomycetota bacterium]MDP6941488.1 L-aspartate oxidase [Planctomycetota bacterium]